MVAVIALAVYRVAWMVTAELGPFAIFEKWRMFIRKKFPISRDNPQHWLDAGVNCPLCVGVYLSAAFYALWQWEFIRFFIIFLAIAGLQCFLERRK